MFNGDGNHYTSNSGNTYITNYVTVADSFNTTHSHNGHGRGGWCGVVAVILGLGIPVMVIWFIVSLLSEVLR